MGGRLRRAYLPVALLVAVLAAPTAARAMTWTDYGSNPVIAPSHQAYYPDAAYDASQFSGHGTSAYYKVWYDDGGSIWMAYSNDARSWTGFGSSPVIADGRHPVVLYDSAHFGNNAGDFIQGSSGSMYLVTPYYKMWYWEPNLHEILFAYSFDGETWQTNYTADVVPHSRFPDWPAVDVYSVAVVYDGSSYRGWADNNGRLYNVSSSDGTTWTVGSKALDIGAPGTWDSDSLSRCSVVHIPAGPTWAAGWYMFYGGTDGGGGGNHGIGLARSTDGITWTKDPANPITSLGGYGTYGGLGAPGSWNGDRNYAMTVLFNANSFGGHGDAAPLKMLRSGRIGSVYTIGLAFGAPDPVPTVNTPASSMWSLALLGCAGLGVAEVVRRKTPKTDERRSDV